MTALPEGEPRGVSKPRGSRKRNGTQAVPYGDVFRIRAWNNIRDGGMRPIRRLTNMSEQAGKVEWKRNGTQAVPYGENQGECGERTA